MAGTDIENFKPVQEVARLAFGSIDSWNDKKKTIATSQQCADAIAMYREQLVPVTDHCPDLLSLDEKKVAKALQENKFAHEIAHGLKMLGRKVMPTASKEQVQHWLAAVTTSLCGLPGPVAVAAVKAARVSDTPPRFAPEIEPLVRKCAMDVQNRYDIAIWRLKYLRDELYNIENPPISLPPPPKGTLEQWTQFNEDMRAMGFKLRYFEGEDKVRDLLEDEDDPAPDFINNDKDIER